MIVYGPWIWRDTGAGFAWTPPPETTALLDLRSIDACAQAGGEPQGIGMFEVTTDPGPPYTEAAPSPTALIPADVVATLVARLGLTTYQVRSQSTIDLLWEILTQHADPDGHRLAPPLMPTAAGDLILTFGGVRRTQRLAVGDPEWPLVQRGFHAIYRQAVLDVITCRAPHDLHRKMLSTFLQTMRTTDYRLFIPPGFPDDPPLPPSTTITDNFTRADANPISASAEGWSWNALSGTWQIIGNKCRGISLEAYCRAEFDLVSANNTSQTTVNHSGSAQFTGVIARFQSAASTGYIGFCATNIDDARIEKIVTGTRSALTIPASGPGTVAPIPTGSVILVKADGSSLLYSVNGTTAKTATDTLIFAGTRTGIWAYGGEDRTFFQGADVAAAPADITATLTATLGVLTCSATATAAVTGTLTQTLGVLTCSATARTTSTLYAKAAGGNWSSASTWSAISSAGTDSAGPPEATTPYDVVFNAGSGNVTIDAGASCRSLNCTGYTGTLAHADVQLALGHLTAAPGLVLLKFSAAMTYLPLSTTSLIVVSNSIVVPVHTLQTSGKTLGALTVNGPGTAVLVDDLTVTGPIIISDGYFSSDSWTVTCDTFSAVGGSTVFSASVINLTRTSLGGIFQATAPATIAPGTSNIVILNPSTSARTFAGGDKTFYDLTYTVAGSTGALTITGANTFHALRVSDASNARTLTLPAGETTAVTSFAVNGSAGKLISVLSSTTGTQAILSAASHQSCNFLSLKDSAATGGGTWYAGTTSTNVSNNTGWLFADPAWVLNQTLGALTLTASAITEAYGLMVADDGAAGYWPLNERTGATIAHDYTGTRPGTLVGGVQSGRPGFWGRAMAFYGESLGGTPGHIDLGGGAPALATAFSMDLWAYILTSARSHALVAKGPPTFSADRPEDVGLFLFYLIGTNHLGIDTNGPSQAAGFGAITVDDRAWHHLAFTYNGAGVTKLYVDGVFDVGVSVGFAADDGSQVTYLGDYPYFAAQSYGWDGLMQAVAWYPTALTSAQILEHYQLGLALAGTSIVRRPLSVLELAGDDDMLRYNIATPITPSDSTNLARATDAIYIGVSGDLVVLLQNGQTRTFVDLAAGSILPMIVTRINATNTTAASLLALYTQ